MDNIPTNMFCQSSGCWPRFMDNSPLPTCFVTALVVGSHGQHPSQHALPKQCLLALLHAQLLSQPALPQRLLLVLMDNIPPNTLCRSSVCWLHFMDNSALPTCFVAALAVWFLSTMSLPSMLCRSSGCWPHFMDNSPPQHGLSQHWVLSFFSLPFLFLSFLVFSFFLFFPFLSFFLSCVLSFVFVEEEYVRPLSTL